VVAPEDRRRVVGMLSRSDLIAAYNRTVATLSGSAVPAWIRSAEQLASEEYRVVVAVRRPGPRPGEAYELPIRIGRSSRTTSWCSPARSRPCGAPVPRDRRRAPTAYFGRFGGPFSSNPRPSRYIRRSQVQPSVEPSAQALR
jgi:hypothetical protein